MAEPHDVWPINRAMEYSNSAKWPKAIAAAGAVLAGAALFNRWSADRAERAHPAQGQFIDIDGVRLHYVERGNGPAVVLLHGSGAIVEDFLVSGIVDSLAKDRRVIVFDRPGYGYSCRPRDRDWTAQAQTDLFVAACERLDIDRPTVVGHSWGTLPALAWAIEHPDALSALVLMSGYYFSTPRADVAMSAIAGTPGLGDVLVNTVLPIQTRITGPLGIKMIFSPREAPQRFMDEMPFALMLRPGQLHATAQDSGQMHANAASLEDLYASIAAPVTIIWGDGDKLVDPKQHSEALAEKLPAARTLRLPDVGHMVHHSEPTLVSDAILVASA
jgi:pimeloyl-ACP methyl ester carboxylesterase